MNNNCQKTQTVQKPNSNQAILPVKKQELIAFLYDTFGATPGEPVKLTRTHFTGRFITSLRKDSDVPDKSPLPDGWMPVVVEFPKSDNINSDRHFNYFPMEHAEQINDFLQASFDLFFHVYFFDLGNLRTIDCDDGEETAITKMHLVDSFVSGLNLIDMGSANETIKKREYRREVEILTQKRARFIKKERRFRLEIYNKRREYIKSILNQ
jgi:hypothetical protein